MITFIQRNLRNAVLEQLVCEMGTQVVIFSEPYWSSIGLQWFFDNLVTVAVGFQILVGSKYLVMDLVTITSDLNCNIQQSNVCICILFIVLRNIAND